MMTNWSAMAKGHYEWYLAASLIALGNEINVRWPNRDTASDGAIGDASHQARVSDHNPDWSAGGVVRAIDIDKDGIDVQALLNATIGDQRVWYVIWDGHIYSRTYNWAKRVYTGSDPHTGHVHISIVHNRTAENDTSRWFPITPPKDDDMALSQDDKDFIEATAKKYAIANNDYLRQMVDDIGNYAAAATDAAEKDDFDAVKTQLSNILNAVQK